MATTYSLYKVHGNEHVHIESEYKFGFMANFHPEPTENVHNLFLCWCSICLFVTTLEFLFLFVFVLMIIVADKVTASLNNSQQCMHTAKVIMTSSEFCLEASHRIVYVQRWIYSGYVGGTVHVMKVMTLLFVSFFLRMPSRLTHLRGRKT